MKMRPQNSLNCCSNTSDDGEPAQSKGYRLMDLKKLPSTLSEAHMCNEGKSTVCLTQLVLYDKMYSLVEFGLLF